MICIAWGGMPAYASYAVAALIALSKEEVCVVSTPSDVPRTCDKMIAGHPIHWIHDGDAPSVVNLTGAMPRVLIVSGWFIPSFNFMAMDVRKSGGTVIALLDNRWKLSLRNLLWILTFRYRIDVNFDGFMVPGKSSMRLLRFSGVKTERIACGMYVSNPDLYQNDVRLSLRPRRIVFVGRFDRRKNILPFVQIFLDFAKGHHEWMLDLYGQGELHDDIEALIAENDSAKVVVHEFVQPQQLAEVYRNARALVLPSIEDHWGVVVHEAALSGCALLLSSQVGAAEDLLCHDNGFSFNPKSKVGMRQALEGLALWTSAKWELAECKSKELAAKISPQIFAQNLLRLIERVS